MKIFDISQEVFSCEVYTGDPCPQKTTICSVNNGDLYNLTAFSMCAHNGTHIDAPYHFINDGKAVDEIPLSKTVGLCYVCEFDGVLTSDDAENIYARAYNANADSAKRLLIKGNATVSSDAASVFAEKNIDLIGNESQTIGSFDSPMEVHKILLGKEVVLLEGIRLCNVPEGVYFLSAAPLSLAGADGSPCRAVLVQM